MSQVFGLSLSYYVKDGPESPLALRELTAAFERAGIEFAKFGQYAFPRLIPLLEKAVEKQFAAEGGGANRGHFAPLSKAYAAQKEKDYPGRPILVRTGTMRDGLTKESSAYAQRAYSASQLAFGTMGVPYASFHQTGTDELPDRPPFDFGPEFQKQLVTAMRAAAGDLVKASGLDKVVSVNRELDSGLDRALKGDS